MIIMIIMQLYRALKSIYIYSKALNKIVFKAMKNVLYKLKKCPLYPESMQSYSDLSNSSFKRFVRPWHNCSAFQAIPTSIADQGKCTMSSTPSFSVRSF